MEPWQCIAERNDAIRKWAELEGKSPQMSDDLYRGYAEPAEEPQDRPPAVGLWARLAAWALEVWRTARS
jgi:hypothetical protein